MRPMLQLTQLADVQSCQWLKDILRFSEVPGNARLHQERSLEFMLVDVRFGARYSRWPV